MDRLEELRSLRRKEMKYYYQKVLPNVTRIKILTLTGMALYIATSLFNLNLILETFLYGFQILIGAGLLLSTVEFLVYRVQLTVIRDRIEIIRKSYDKKNPD